MEERIDVEVCKVEGEDNDVTCTQPRCTAHIIHSST
jgi:hypothetical protein